MACAIEQLFTTISLQNLPENELVPEAAFPVGVLAQEAFFFKAVPLKKADGAGVAGRHHGLEAAQSQGTCGEGDELRHDFGHDAFSPVSRRQIIGDFAAPGALIEKGVEAAGAEKVARFAVSSLFADGPTDPLCGRAQTLRPADNILGLLGAGEGIDIHKFSDARVLEMRQEGGGIVRLQRREPKARCLKPGGQFQKILFSRLRRGAVMQSVGHKGGPALKDDGWEAGGAAAHFPGSLPQRLPQMAELRKWRCPGAAFEALRRASKVRGEFSYCGFPV